MATTVSKCVGSLASDKSSQMMYQQFLITAIKRYVRQSVRRFYLFIAGLQGLLPRGGGGGGGVLCVFLGGGVPTGL